MRYNTGGSLDTSFNGTGKRVHDFGGNDNGNALALDASGNLILAGDTLLPTYQFAFSRFFPDGSHSLTKIDDVSGMDDRAYAVAVLRSGKILLAGTTQSPSSPKATLSLYLPNGNQDCGPPVYPVDVFTASSSGDAANGQVMLNWLNPAYGPYDRTVIRRDTAGCPADENSGVLVTTQNDGPGNPGSFVDVVPVGPTYYYAAFALDVSSQASTPVCRTAKPFDRNVGKVEWSYGTSIAALTTPGLRLSSPTSTAAAASAGAGVNDLTAFFSQTDISDYLGMLLNSVPWDKPDLWVERSAYRKVKDVTTPLLIQSGDADRRVSPEQSIQFYEAMKRIGKAPVKLVLYPGQGHGITDPRLSKDRMLRNVEWFSYWIPVVGQKPAIRMN